MSLTQERFNEILELLKDTRTNEEAEDYGLTFFIALKECTTYINELHSYLNQMQLEMITTTLTSPSQEVH